MFNCDKKFQKCSLFARNIYQKLNKQFESNLYSKITYTPNLAL